MSRSRDPNTGRGIVPKTSFLILILHSTYGVSPLRTNTDPKFPDWAWQQTVQMARLPRALVPLSGTPAGLQLLPVPIVCIGLLYHFKLKHGSPAEGAWDHQLCARRLPGCLRFTCAAQMCPYFDPNCGYCVLTKESARLAGYVCRPCLPYWFNQTLTFLQYPTPGTF